MTHSHADRGIAVNVGVNVQHQTLYALFNVERVERRLGHLSTDRFPAERDLVERLGRSDHRIEQSERAYDGALQLLIELSTSACAYLRVDSGDDANAYLSVAADSAAASQSELASLMEILRRDDTDHERVAIRLWSKSGDGPTFTRRVMDAPSLTDVEANYPTVPRERFRSVCETPQNSVGGLALWYGPPGTGKTTAVRTLARAWRSWCDVHVVVDPEIALADPAYLMRIITARSFEEDLPVYALRSHERSRLIVLEDAGELLAADARAVTGQGLSRILNVTDGLIGRGLNTSILITTNEEIGALHPAIRRPGRCWSQIRFGRFSGSEARAWLAGRGVEVETVTGSRSLAELYALERGEALAMESHQPVGFLG